MANEMCIYEKNEMLILNEVDISEKNFIRFF